MKMAPGSGKSRPPCWTHALFIVEIIWNNSRSCRTPASTSFTSIRPSTPIATTKSCGVKPKKSVHLKIGMNPQKHTLTIDAFETALRRSKCEKGFFVSFDYSSDALREIDRFFREDHRIIVPLTVREILDEEIAKKLA